MTLKFFFLFCQLNLDSFFSEKQAEIVEKTRLNVTEEKKVFEYK